MELERCLRPTPFLDYETPALKAWAHDAAGGGSERERAVRLFLRVRDDVRYDPYSVSLDAADFSASAVLAARRGFCVTKAILLAAGWRAIGIPARLGFADVINHLATARLLELLRTELFVFHGYVEGFIDGRWAKATPAFNASLCARFGTEPLDFDGVHDAVLQPLNREGARFMEYVRDRGTFDDFSLEAMLAAWREVYPHLFEATPVAPGGDFEAEAAQESGPPRR